MATRRPRRGANPAAEQLLDPGEGLEALKLGTYIFTANPYKAGLPPKGTWPGPDSENDFPPSVVPLVIVDPDDPGPPPEHDPPYMLCTSDTELQENPGNWKFKYGELYVKRAIRIKYMYYKVSDADPTQGMLVNDYFLIGFEGGGAY
jgi:hypothetical protein